jgi:hypothetical protein
MAVIKISVPKTPKSAFNKNRPASGLLIAQLEHLETAAGNYPSETKKRRKQLTEGQVAARIHELTRTLHPQAAHVQLPTARMISHAEEPGAAGGGAAPAGRKTPKKAALKKAAAPTRGRKARKRD